MKILTIAATESEVFPLVSRFTKVRGNSNFRTGKIGTHVVEVLVTGVGMTATAFHLGRTLSEKKYDLAINAGVAGSFRNRLALGEIVNVVSDCFADLGAEDGKRFLTLKEMGLTKVSGFKPQVLNQDVPPGLKKVKGITVNAVHGNWASIKKVVKKFNPDIESMEGAAFFYACNHFKIPCLQVRSISNYVERRNKKNWKLDVAIKNLNAYLEQLFLRI